MLVIEFQASKTSGSEKKIFKYFFLCISIARTYNPWPEAILDPGTYI